MCKMIELTSALIGAIATCAITLYGIHLQFKKQNEEREQDYKNDIVSMLDIMVFKAAKVRNNTLTFNNSNLNKSHTDTIAHEVIDDFTSLDQQLQELIVMMSHHLDDSNNSIQTLLKKYEPLELSFNKFKVAHRIYMQRYEEAAFEKNTIVFSKRLLDIEVGNFIDQVITLGNDGFNHRVFSPKLTDIISKKHANKYSKNPAYATNKMQDKATIKTN